MIIKKKHIVPPTPGYESERISGVKCDICYVLYEGNVPDYNHEVDFSKSTYEINTTCLYKKEGNSYPEGGSATISYYTICPDCFEKIEEYLKQFGATPTIVEEDW